VAAADARSGAGCAGIAAALMTTSQGLRALNAQRAARGAVR